LSNIELWLLARVSQSFSSPQYAEGASGRTLAACPGPSASGMLGSATGILILGVLCVAQSLGAQRQAMLEEIAARSGLELVAIEAALAADPSPTRGLGLWPTFRRMIADDLRRRQAAKALRREIQRRRPLQRRSDMNALREVVRLASREMALLQQARMLGATHNILRFWHVAHRPLAITALAAVIIHVAVVVSLGATWFW